jgi:hypothetical protein
MFVRTLFIVWMAVVPVQGADLADRFPPQTAVFIGWPGWERYSETFRDTAMGRLRAEPEMVRLRDAWNNRIWPAIDELIREEAGGDPDAAAYEPIVAVLKAAWKHPLAIGLIDVGMGPQGPSIDLAVVIRAGAEAAALGEQLDRLMEIAVEEADPTLEIGEATVAGVKLKLLAPPEAPGLICRWGVMGEEVVFTLGESFHSHAEAKAAGLSKNEAFVAGMKQVGGTKDTPSL